MTMNELPITYRGVVHPWQCDLMGHMNVVWYVSKFDDSAWQLFAMMGMDVNYFKRTNCGVAALQQNITYKAEVHPGSTVTIRSGILELKEKTVRFVHEMQNDATGEIAAVMELTCVHFNTKKRKSCPFPAAMAKRCRNLIVQSGTNLSLFNRKIRVRR
jgi:acyl-CoA thioester hydrolase